MIINGDLIMQLLFDFYKGKQTSKNTKIQKYK